MKRAIVQVREYLAKWLGHDLREHTFMTGYKLATHQERIMALERRVGNLEILLDKARGKE